MIEALLLTALLSAEPSAPARADGLRRELDGVAARIAELKARAMDGEDVRAELQPLLVRSQELAEALERTSPGPVPAPSPSATVEDLRARADALYQEADRVAGALAEAEARISAALNAGTRQRRAGDPPAPPVRPGAISVAAVQVERASPVSAGQPAPAVVPLLQERARLKARVRELLAEAAELDDAADRLER